MTTPKKGKKTISKLAFLLTCSFLPLQDIILKISKLSSTVRILLSNSVLLKQTKRKTLNLRLSDLLSNE